MTPAHHNMCMHYIHASVSTFLLIQTAHDNILLSSQSSKYRYDALRIPFEKYAAIQKPALQSLSSFKPDQASDEGALSAHLFLVHYSLGPNRVRVVG